MTHADAKTCERQEKAKQHDSPGTSIGEVERKKDERRRRRQKAGVGRRPAEDHLRSDEEHYDAAKPREQGKRI